jgi:hypothetical protein
MGHDAADFEPRFNLMTFLSALLLICICGVLSYVLMR